MKNLNSECSLYLLTIFVLIFTFSPLLFKASKNNYSYPLDVAILYFYSLLANHITVFIRLTGIVIYQNNAIYVK